MPWGGAGDTVKIMLLGHRVEMHSIMQAQDALASMRPSRTIGLVPSSIGSVTGSTVFYTGAEPTRSPHVH